MVVLATLRLCETPLPMAWALDLDGVVWLGDTPIPGAADAVARLRGGRGARRLRDQQLLRSAFRRGGQADEARHRPRRGRRHLRVVAASLVRSGERALVCGARASSRSWPARGRRGRRRQRAGGHRRSFDVVVVGYHPTFDYQRMDTASAAVRAGARLLATNDDATYPMATGIKPGGGAILASIATASGVVPEVAGKPHRPAADWVRDAWAPTGSWSATGPTPTAGSPWPWATASGWC